MDEKQMGWAAPLSRPNPFWGKTSGSIAHWPLPKFWSTSDCQQSSVGLEILIAGMLWLEVSSMHTSLTFPVLALLSQFAAFCLPFLFVKLSVEWGRNWNNQQLKYYRVGSFSCTQTINDVCSTFKYLFLFVSVCPSVCMHVCLSACLCVNL